MNKKWKCVLFAAGLIAAPTCINSYIFSKAGKKRRIKIQESFFEWRFGKIRYVTAGEGEPLLLLHGLRPGASLAEWEDNIKALSAHYCVYAFDFLGFGYSDKPDITYSAYLYTVLINDFISGVICRPTYVAASNEAAGFVAAAYGFKPELFTKMLLISPVSTPTDICLWNKRLIELPIFGTFFYNCLSSKIYLKQYLKKYVYHKPSIVTKRLVDGYYDSAHAGGACAKLPIAALLSGLMDVPVASLIKKLEIPVELLWGTDNSFDSDDSFHPFQTAKSNAGLTVFSGSGSLPHAENPKAFYKLSRKFFK